MSVSTTRAATPFFVALEGRSVIGFKDGQAGVKQFTLGHDNDVETLSDLVTAKNLSNESLSPVALNGAAKLSCRRDSQPRHGTFAGQNEHSAVAAMYPRSPLIHLLKLCSPANPFGGTKSGHGPVRACASRSRRSVASGLLRDGVSRRDGHFWWTSVREIHASAFGDACWVGTCACLSWPPFV